MVLLSSRESTDKGARSPVSASLKVPPNTRNETQELEARLSCAPPGILLRYNKNLAVFKGSYNARQRKIKIVNLYLRQTPQDRFC